MAPHAPAPDVQLTEPPGISAGNWSAAAWTGITKLADATNATNSTWQDARGPVNSSAIPWCPDEPNDRFSSESCSSLLTSCSADGATALVNDYACDKPLRVLCMVESEECALGEQLQVLGCLELAGGVFHECALQVCSEQLRGCNDGCPRVHQALAVRCCLSFAVRSPAGAVRSQPRALAPLGSCCSCATPCPNPRRLTTAAPSWDPMPHWWTGTLPSWQQPRGWCTGPT
jgi:hypothetical protein